MPILARKSCLGDAFGQWCRECQESSTRISNLAGRRGRFKARDRRTCRLGWLKTLLRLACRGMSASLLSEAPLPMQRSITWWLRMSFKKLGRIADATYCPALRWAYWPVLTNLVRSRRYC